LKLQKKEFKEYFGIEITVEAAKCDHFGHDQSNGIYEMITLTGDFLLLLSNVNRTLNCDHIKRLITLTRDHIKRLFTVPE